MSANTYVSYPFPLPLLTIAEGPGGFTRMCYSETVYEVVSRFPLDEDDFKHLDACNLLGIGQAYSVQKAEKFEAESQPTTVDKKTKLPTGEPPTAWNGEPITNTVKYEYHRYTVRRICDSGD